MKKLICAAALLAAGVGLADEDANDPILPGWGKYYWNPKARWYIHPPAFAFTNVEGAVAYRYRVIDDALVEHVFADTTPNASLKPVWAKLPAKGMTAVYCRGVDAQGRELALAGSARFWKNAPFTPGKYAPAKRSYAEAARKANEYIFALPCLKVLAETGKPDFSYRLNCYPAKMNASVIRAAVGYAKQVPSRKDEMLKVARAAADYLISVSEPAGTPLAHFAPTYAEGNKNYTAGRYAGQHMLIYPADAAGAYLTLYESTKDVKYLRAAEAVASTYLKLQGEDGTWYLKMWAKDGKCVKPNRLFPLPVCSLLERLYALTGKKAYRQASDRAFAYVEKGPLANWNWEGQFEDVEPTAMYQNLTKHPACSTAMYLLKRYPDDPARLAQARELVRFSEDQFIAWERPCREDGSAWLGQKGYDPRRWTTFPTVMEQYHWYVPTDASVAKLIRTFLAMYRATKESVYLAKAKALGDAFTNVQEESGRIPTQWMEGVWMTDPQTDWVNCMIASAGALEELSQH